ncbi:heterokaryon incompatibility protein-domain-containing protein [Xylariaceae sp. FL0662B]|nr:heterokaryon incompatibility protein-domain-containing protein [Xylariaceae sp. FL0662B]
MDSDERPTYRPLCGSEIRLILIQPGLPNDPMRCELDYVSLDDKPRYCALSYVWGDENDTRNIELNGRPFPISANLYDALWRIRCIQMEEFVWQEKKIVTARRYLNGPVGFWKWDQAVLDQHKSRQPMRSLEAILSERLFCKPLWIDALCINQQGIRERSQQVPRMRDIYSAALTTVAWLGNPESPKQRTRIDKIVDASDELCSLAILQAEGFGKYPAASDRGRGYAETVFHLFDAVMRRPWFLRIWIVQEVVLSTATVFLIGDRITCLDSLYHLNQTFASGEKNAVVLLPPALRAWLRGGFISNIMSLTHNYGPRASRPDGQAPPPAGGLDAFAHELFDILMRAHRRKEAKDQRDMIYGVLGMTRIPGDLPPELVPNYYTPYETVFRRYFRFLIERTGDLRCLSWREARVPNAPTWVPDLKQVMPQVGKGPRSSVAFSSDEWCMRVEGSWLGSCVRTLSYESQETSRDFHGMLNEFHNTIIRPWSESKKMPQDRVISEWLDYGLAESQFIEYPFNIQSVKVCYKLWTHESSELLTSLVLRYLRSGAEEKYLRTIRAGLATAVWGNSFFVTDAGAVGFVHRSSTLEVRNGDVLCSLKGWYELCILRPVGNAYEFIKDCKIISREPLSPHDEDWWKDRPTEYLSLI